jgi:hypothetical protein
MAPRIHAVPEDPKDPDDGGGDNYDPFDPSSHKVGRSPDYGIEKMLTSVPVRKPGRHTYFRSHPDPSYRQDVLIFERKDAKDTELYLVHKRVEHLFHDELTPVRLVTTITKQNTVFLCPIRIWGGDFGGGSKFERLFSTAMKVVQQSETLWVRRKYNFDLGGYDGEVAKGDLGEPKWPDLSFKELYRVAFEDRLIEDDQHPVVKELRGEI